MSLAQCGRSQDRLSTYLNINHSTSPLSMHISSELPQRPSQPPFQNHPTHMPRPIRTRKPQETNPRIHDLRHHRARSHNTHRMPIRRKTKHQHTDADTDLPCTDGRHEDRDLGQVVGVVVGWETVVDCAWAWVLVEGMEQWDEEGGGCAPLAG